MKVKTTEPVFINGTAYDTDQVVEVDAVDASTLVGLGRAVVITEEEAAKQAKKKD